MHAIHALSAFLGIAALAIAACDVSEAPPGEMPTLRSAPSVAELEALYCKEGRQIVRLGAGASQCPAVAGWSAASVFPGKTGELGKFCKYDWNGGAGTLPNVNALRAAAGVLQAKADCGGVLDHTTDALVDAIGPEVEYAFHHGIGRPTAADLNLPATEAFRSKVAVAVVDSVPEPKPANPRSLHGEFMVSLINDIACPAGVQGCAVSVVRSLGLPRYIGANGEMDLVDTVRGGYYGTQRDVAKAIYDAVETWKATDWGGEPAKLIINLSVGWDRLSFGDVSDPSLRPGVAAVYAAIEYARCHGALVIAAAGNRGYTCETGPVAPAAWEQYPAPGNARCSALGAPTPPPSGIGYSPLVYSVGGLTRDHEEMPRSRFAGKPRLAALATNAVTSGAMRTVTGTSAAVAVASGAAALLWSYNPHLTPSEVMATLYQTGTTTTLDADYSLAVDVTTDVRAIDVCAALDAACELPAATCPFASPLACLDAPPPVPMTDLFDELAEAYDHDVPASATGEAVVCQTECGLDAQAYLAGGSGTTACPEPSSIARPYALPQPTQIGCPNCTLDLTSNAVYASIDPEFQGKTINDVTISVIDRDTNATTYFRYGALSLFVGAITRITLDASRMPDDVRSASIVITFDGVPVVDPLLLGP